jgi:hypothetical protein
MTIPLVTSLSGHSTDDDFPFTASLSAMMKPKYSCVESKLFGGHLHATVTITDRAVLIKNKQQIVDEFCSTKITSSH